LTPFVQQGFATSHSSTGGPTVADRSRKRAAGGSKTIRYTMTNQEALRRQLEQQGIDRKLGY
jgi:hypothetical protein